MACRSAYRLKANENAQMIENEIPKNKEMKISPKVSRLLFGADSKVPADDVLQNNLTEFEWVKRNKLYPVFFGRNIVGEDSLTKEEIDFLHEKGCKIVPIYRSSTQKKTDEQGMSEAEKIVSVASKLDIPHGTVIFFEFKDAEKVSRDFMRGYAKKLISKGYIPGFKANTDAKFSFDKEFSRGMQTNRRVFSECLIWAVSPSLEEYDRITTSHLIHPDEWKPFAPSGITRNEIAIWQYGKNCHPIYDDVGRETTFNLNLVRNEAVIIEKMF